MSVKPSPVERATDWRKDRLAAGYQQKVFLLSPEAIDGLSALTSGKKRAERETVEKLIIQAAKRKARNA